MSQVGARPTRTAALLTSGVLAVSVLAGCGSGDEENRSEAAAPVDIAPTARDRTADGGTLRWAVDALPSTLNAFQADADAATSRVTGAVLPTLFTLDERGRPRLNPDYLESAEIVEREPRQVVLYKLHQQAVWSDGREIGAPDFVAQWRALNGRNSAYWTARNAGYERIAKIERGADDLQVRVTFSKPYGDWKALFSPLYPKEVMGSPDAFNDRARTKLAQTAGPFQIKATDSKAKSVTLVRNPRWWGAAPKLQTLVLRAVPREKRAAALAGGTLDIAEIDPSVAARIARAAKDAGGAGPLAHGPGVTITPADAIRSWAVAYGSDEDKAAEEREAREQNQAAFAAYAAEQAALRGYVVRKTLEPAYTQLALNGEAGPLADERVRRAVARALDRQELAEAVLDPLGLPAEPVGSHLALAGQAAYADSSGALGGQDTEEALALLADAGWTTAGARATATPKDGTKAGAEASKAPASGSPSGPGGAASGSPSPTARAAAETASDKAADRASDEGLYIVGDDKSGDDARSGDEKNTHILAPAPVAALHSALVRQARALTEALTGAKAEAAAGGADGEADAKDGSGPGQTARADGVPGAYAPRGTAAPAPADPESARAAAGPLGKDGQPLSLRFVLPSGPGSEALRTVGDRIVRMLDRIGIRTEIVKVSDDSFFKDHIASGDYDLALYSWPGTAYPATDGRPIFAKPSPATDGSLLVEQNYTRVGTDHIDQLFEQAAAELDEKAARDLVRQADARIWAAAGSIPLYQRPQLVAVKRTVVNAGAFGFRTPRYENVGFRAPEKK
ncbi:ABC transporter family substrate-binding protein [Streptomyces sp. MUM 203J]|uniref:ABC transporter substrate-binding protein n=1 Tax=Streptomyces sp. MUM 203J TaxID=2791990 RepID=UPI001F04AEC8|nr:ABC transporter substrate-binding protein [Streptomyces sp. MUM 203J]MCH0540110.1 ABC transporter family substrate-binding protein [Streptomyces sp. MUM 203J]